MRYEYSRTVLYHRHSTEAASEYYSAKVVVFFQIFAQKSTLLNRVEPGYRGKELHEDLRPALFHLRAEHVQLFSDVDKKGTKTYRLN